MSLSKEFKDFILRKHLAMEEIEQDFSDRIREDEYNTDYAEELLNVAYDLFPDGTDTEDNLMDKRHGFVDEMLELIYETIICKWAGNLGMVTIKKAQETANAQVEEVAKMYKAKISLQASNFNKMSGYEFAKWKLDYLTTVQKENAEKIMNNDFCFKTQKSEKMLYDQPELDDWSEDRVPQDSEDEAWEQLMAFQKANFKDV